MFSSGTNSCWRGFLEDNMTPEYEYYYTFPYDPLNDSDDAEFLHNVYSLVVPIIADDESEPST